jgi:spore germination cell wall hydrolase CwlJ-like protein
LAAVIKKEEIMYFNRKLTNKVLIGISMCLIAVNLLIPVAKAQIINVSKNNIGSHFSNEVQCLAENIYFEAASESFEGKLAVAQVTINRLNSGKFAKTICGVVKQKDVINGVMVCQFSWFCNEAYTKLVRNKYQWEESVLVAKKALTSEVAHDTLHREKAMYYHANYVKPNWNLPKITQIGAHIFYKERSRI